MTIKIKVCDPVPDGACCFYRSLGPLSKLQKLNPNISIEHMQVVSWYTMTDADILFFERPQDKSYLEAIELAKDYNIPVWIDFDDNLFDLPDYNPGYSHYNKKNIREIVANCIKLADVVTVSTQAVKDAYEYLNPNIIVIENALNDYNFPLKKVQQKFKTISWRGSNTHRRDLLSCSQGIFNIAEKYIKDWAWVFIGGKVNGDLWYITDGVKNHFNMKESDIITYHKYIKDLAPTIQIVPLVNNEFNKGKSNIAWIEGTWSGAATVAPNLPEFEKPGVINYNTEKDGSFEYTLEKLIKSTSFRDQKYNESFEYIHDNLLLSKINNKRLEVIKELLGR